MKVIGVPEANNTPQAEAEAAKLEGLFGELTKDRKERHPDLGKYR
jgi:hypothetical protein